MSENIVTFSIKESGGRNEILHVSLTIFLLLVCIAPQSKAITFNNREYAQIEGCYYQLAHGDTFQVTGTYLFVTFHPWVTQLQIDNLNTTNNGSIYRDRSNNRFTIFCNDTQEDPLDFCASYLNSPYVYYTKNLTELKFAVFPNDELFEDQVYLRDQDEDGFDNDIDIGRAWDLIRGPNADEEDPPVIGMIDDGLLYWHPDIVNNVWQNIGEDADGDGVTLIWDPDLEWPEEMGVGRYKFDDEGWNGENNNGDLDGIDNDGNGWIDILSVLMFHPTVQIGKRINHIHIC